MTTKMQISDWFETSARAVSALGTTGFAPALTTALRSIVPYEFTVIFAYYRDHKPLDLYDDFPAAKRKVMVDDYQEGPYLLDPFYLNTASPTTPRLARLRDLAPDRFYQAEYFRNYYIQTGLAEEIGFIVEIGEGVSVVISAMREHKVFSAREFRDLETMERPDHPILGAAPDRRSPPAATDRGRLSKPWTQPADPARSRGGRVCAQGSFRRCHRPRLGHFTGNRAHPPPQYLRETAREFARRAVFQLYCRLVRACLNTRCSAARIGLAYAPRVALVPNRFIGNVNGKANGRQTCGLRG